MYVICMTGLVILGILIGALAWMYFAAEYRIDELEKDVDILRNRIRKIDRYLSYKAEEEKRRKQ